jgi:hypothetical protein
VHQTLALIGPDCEARTFCTAKTSSSGCVPSIGATGSTSIAAGDFAITGAALEGGQFAVVVYGTQGGAAIPFQGGFLCVAPPLARLQPMATGGAQGACDGSLAQPAAGVLAAVGPGNGFHAQIWFRDPGAASGSGLSEGLEVVACP